MRLSGCRTVNQAHQILASLPIVMVVIEGDIGKLGALGSVF
jgi:hypothetical protein